MVAKRLANQWYQFRFFERCLYSSFRKCCIVVTPCLRVACQAVLLGSLSAAKVILTVVVNPTVGEFPFFCTRGVSVSYTLLRSMKDASASLPQLSVSLNWIVVNSPSKGRIGPKPVRASLLIPFPLSRSPFTVHKCPVRMRCSLARSPTAGSFFFADAADTHHVLCLPLKDFTE